MDRTFARVVFLLAVLLPASAGAANEPIFAGVWSKKEAGGVGGLYYDQSWDQLLANWKTLGANQYLANVEAYKVGDRWRYAAVWRVGPGNGGLLLAPWNDFLKAWNDLMKTQDLIDLEVLDTGDGRKYLGVWRVKQEPGGTGALFIDLTWDELVAKRAELGLRQYLADVETYGSDKKRLFAGVWRLGPGNGALFWKKDWSGFADLKRSLNKTQEMLDFEMFQADNGDWNFLGVWRVSNRAGPLHASQSTEKLVPLSAAQFIERWKQNQDGATLIGIDVVVPAVPALTALRGDTSCKYGDVDCNRCAKNVEQRFQLAFETGGKRPWIGWHARSWTFTGNSQYPPDRRKPESAFFPWGEGGKIGIASKHIQGFVRTNSSSIPYAGSHSHKNQGSIFFIGREGGNNVLHSLYKSHYDHPSGVAVLGGRLFVAEQDRLRWFDIRAAGNSQDHGYKIEESEKGSSGTKGLQGAGGGLGLAKLYDGTTLLIVSAPGDGFRWSSTAKAKDENREARYTRFYRLVPNAFAKDPEQQFLGDWRHEGLVANPDKPRGYSENVSVVTECDTGRIYTIHTTGDYKLLGDGYWRLSRIEMDAKGPRLVHRAIKRQGQHNEKCHHRSSATVHVRPDGELGYLCSERAVIKWNPTGKFNFREGTSGTP